MAPRDPRHCDRFMLWIDAVGGYWVCLGNEITIGQPNRQATADVPISGDLAGNHARIRRNGEGHLVEAIREVLVDGCPVDNVGWLRDGSQIQLGHSVRLLFRRPHALSGTARFDFLSGHRTQPSADAVLWMADTCILGPSRDCHVVCRDWTQHVILYRDESQLCCHSDGPFEIDGVACNGCGRVSRNSRIQGDGFSFNLEAIT